MFVQEHALGFHDCRTIYFLRRCDHRGVLGPDSKLMSGAKSPAQQKPASAESQSQSTDASRSGRDSGGPPADSTSVPQSDVVEFEFVPVTANEVRTKLELARTFLDMGDPASARHMLDEVLEEGDAALKQEAQRLIDSMPRSS